MSIFAVPSFYNQADQNIFSCGDRFITQERFRLGDPIQKNISFYLLDFQSSYPNYYNYLHIIPKVVIGVLALIGGFISLFKKKGKEREINFFLFYYIFYGSIFSVFFILPRYSLMLLPIQIILLCILLSEIKYLKRFK